MPKPSVTSQIRRRDQKRARREHAIANKTYLGFIPAWLIPSWGTLKKIAIPLLLIGGGLAAWSMRQSNMKDSSAPAPKVPPSSPPKGSITDSIHVNGTDIHNPVHGSWNRISAATQSNGTFISPQTRSHSDAKNRPILEVSSKRPLDPSHIKEIQHHYPQLIDALGGIEKMASYEFRRGDRSQLGKNIDPRTVTEPVTLHTDGEYYYVTLRYEHEKITTGEKSIQVETFYSFPTSFGFSDGLKDVVTGKGFTSRAVSSYTRGTDRDLEYLRKLVRGESVWQRDGGSTVMSREDMIKTRKQDDQGGFKEIWDHPVGAKEVQDCLAKPTDGICSFGLYRKDETPQVRLAAASSPRCSAA